MGLFVAYSVGVKGWQVSPNYALLGTTSGWWYVLELLTLFNATTMFFYSCFQEINYKESYDYKKENYNLIKVEERDRTQVEVTTPSSTGSSFIHMTEPQADKGLKKLINFFKAFRLKHIEGNEFELVNDSDFEITNVNLDLNGFEGATYNIPQGKVIPPGKSHKMSLEAKPSSGVPLPDHFWMKCEELKDPVWLPVPKPPPPLQAVTRR